MHAASSPPTRFTAVAVTVCLLLATNSSLAQQSIEGVWEWTQTAPNRPAATVSAELQPDGTTLKGKLRLRAGREADIQEGKVEGDRVRFQLRREQNGMPILTRYDGRLKDGRITGTIEIDRGNDTAAQPWDAKRRPKDPSPQEKFGGVWKWEFVTGGGDPIETKLELALDDRKVAGTLSLRDIQNPVTEGRVDNNNIRFRVERTRNGIKQYTLYEGELDGRVIRGRQESNFGGEVRSRDWEAYREDDFAKRQANVTGTWKYTFPGNAGQSFEPTLLLKHTGTEITGSLRFNENETPIADARVDGSIVRFEVRRQRDGQELVSRFTGTVTANRIDGEIVADWAGVHRTYPWQARRIRR